LTAVTNAQVIKVTLTEIRDSAGGQSNAFSASMGLLLGDTNGDGSVNMLDSILSRFRLGDSVTNSNFRKDVNTDGVININDSLLVRKYLGTTLPP
jgi:hypothetical protein